MVDRRFAVTRSRCRWRCGPVDRSMRPRRRSFFVSSGKLPSHILTIWMEQVVQDHQGAVPRTAGRGQVGGQPGRPRSGQAPTGPCSTCWPADSARTRSAARRPPCRARPGAVRRRWPAGGPRRPAQRAASPCASHSPGHLGLSPPLTVAAHPAAVKEAELAVQDVAQDDFGHAQLLVDRAGHPATRPYRPAAASDEPAAPAR